jgi:osmotically-inducible protein OsmY
MKAKQDTIVNRQLRERVEYVLDWEPEVTSTDIGVSTDDGVVTLSGNVASYSEKLAAEKAALRTFGVKGVANEIVVQPPYKVTDADIAKTALAAIGTRSDFPGEAVKVTVKDGVVYLDGQMAWDFQRKAAEDAVKHVFGTRSVRNRIEIKPSASRMEVRDKIEAAFRHSAEIDARRLNVITHEGTVELWGHVRTWNEKQEAERAAWAAPGVTKVENHLMVVP